MTNANHTDTNIIYNSLKFTYYEILWLVIKKILSLPARIQSMVKVMFSVCLSTGGGGVGG